jgi:hypothetical protein
MFLGVIMLYLVITGSRGRLSILPKAPGIGCSLIHLRAMSIFAWCIPFGPNLESLAKGDSVEDMQKEGTPNIALKMVEGIVRSSEPVLDAFM